MSSHSKIYNIDLSSVFSVLFSSENQTPEEVKKTKVMSGFLRLGDYYANMGYSQFFDVLERGGVDPDIMKLLRLFFKEKETSERLDVPTLDAVKDDPEEKMSQEKINFEQDLSYENLYTQLREHCKSGNLDAVKKLFNQMTPVQVKRSLGADNFYCFWISCRGGYSEITELLLENMSQIQVAEAIEKDNFWSFKWSCNNGYAKVTKVLLKYMTPEQTVKGIKSGWFSCLVWSCEKGHTETVKLLMETMTPVEIKQAIEVNGFSFLRYSCHEGHTGVVEILLKNMTPKQRKRGIKSDDFYCLKWSCAERPEMLELLLKNMTLEDVQTALEANSFRCLRFSYATGATSVCQIKLLLSYLTEEQRTRIPRDIVVDLYNLGIGNLPA